ncbi:hypothetical protein MTR_5g085740 [Medicago truncatula]|uniref:Uncharacterized protein n=1 Tax=Medicago truncatula TaxID=3880 RepID=G7K7J3_MEDTR|nr:hypothetical protein MTR_5g085740 [Medicago truncatula]
MDFTKRVFGSTLNRIDSDIIDSVRIDSDRIDFKRIDLCTQSITTYIHSLKQTGDLLASLGSPLFVEDITDYILRGLNDGYRTVIDGGNARDNSITFDDILEKLLIQELSTVAVQQQTSTPFTTLNAQARLIYNYKPRPAHLPAQSNQRIGNRHVLSQCRTFRRQHPGIPPRPRDSPQVNTAAAGPQQTDFMAIHHPYTGPDSLFMGNDSCLNISHSGTLLINDLSLSNALCVPSMKQ